MKILIIEDEYNLADAISSTLKYNNYLVDIFTDANDYASRNINYDLKKGKVYAIRGRSSTGKTTLLSLITGLEKCSEGNIIFDGKDLNNINLDKYRNQEIGIVFQSYNLLPL